MNQSEETRARVATHLRAYNNALDLPLTRPLDEAEGQGPLVYCGNVKWCEAMLTPGFTWTEHLNVYTLTMPRFKVADEGHVVFEILLKCGNAEVTVPRRYSEFHRLWTELFAANVVSAWSLPPKTWFRSVDPNFLEERLGGLYRALDELLRQVGNAADVPQIRDFLGLRRIEALAAGASPEASAPSDETMGTAPSSSAMSSEDL